MRLQARVRTWRPALALAALLLWAAPIGAESATAATMKAAFLYNFAKFSEWPADVLAPGQRLSMCVVGDAAVADALTQTIEGHAIDGHPLTVAVLKGDESVAACHLLYVSAPEMKRAGALPQSVRSAPVFTVSDAENFAGSGGVAQLILENSRMRFAINIASARRGRLVISSKLLSLATIVKEDAHAPGR